MRGDWDWGDGCGSDEIGAGERRSVGEFEMWDGNLMV
jgi:hypothetical protein